MRRSLGGSAFPEGLLNTSEEAGGAPPVRAPRPQRCGVGIPGDVKDSASEAAVSHRQAETVGRLAPPSGLSQEQVASGRVRRGDLEP